MSLSKSYHMGWNRIGIRWSKEYNGRDSISIMNKFNMIPQIFYQIGCLYLETYQRAHIVQLYKKEYEML